MSRRVKFIGLAVLIIVTAVVVIMIAAPRVQRSLFYPKPQGLPSRVETPMPHLLSRLQTLLESNAPFVAADLSPGISDADLAQQEAKGGFRLSDDLRQFYKWHNGMTSNTLQFIPGHHFPSLQVNVTNRLAIQQQIASSTPAQRAFGAVFAGHQDTWVDVLPDYFGDGYFYDPMRSEAEGAFFFHFAETGSYLWFPSFRNFLAGVIEGYETGAYRKGTNSTLDEDYDRMQRVWTKFGKVRDEQH